MAKKVKKGKEEKIKQEYPSSSGSHQSMVDEEETKKLTQTGKVVCKDEIGFYVTDEIRLNDGLADPNRYGRPETRRFKNG